MTAAITAPGRTVAIAAVLGVALAGAYLFVLGWALQNASYDASGALIIAPVLAAITVPLARRAAIADNDPPLTAILLTAFVVKLAGSLVRYYVAFSVYGGKADATEYDQFGTKFAPSFRSLNFSVDLGRKFVGTGFTRGLTGVVYMFTGPTMLGGFLVFSWLGFLGLFFFYRALRVGFPAADRRRYAYLLFFLPSLAFWPSSIGKEAWMMFTLGITAYGAARMLSFRRGGFIVFALGLAGTACVRPHVTLIAFLAVGAAYAIRRRPRPTPLGPVLKVAGLVVLAVVGLLVVKQVESFFSINSVNSQSVDSVLSNVNSQTGQGGSEYQTGSRSLTGLPWAAVSVLFRPFPIEAHNGQSLFAALEGTVLMVITAFSIRRLLALRRMAVRFPYAAFALAYVVLFIVAFASVGNFGILARERVQVLPFLLVLLCVPLPNGSRTPPPKRTRVEVGGPLS